MRRDAEIREPSLVVFSKHEYMPLGNSKGNACQDANHVRMMCDLLFRRDRLALAATRQ